MGTNNTLRINMSAFVLFVDTDTSCLDGGSFAIGYSNFTLGAQRAAGR